MPQAIFKSELFIATNIVHPLCPPFTWLGVITTSTPNQLICQLMGCHNCTSLAHPGLLRPFHSWQQLLKHGYHILGISISGIYPSGIHPSEFISFGNLDILYSVHKTTESTVQIVDQWASTETQMWTVHWHASGSPKVPDSRNGSPST